MKIQLLSAAAVLVLSACGGGGGDTPAPVGPTLNLADLQGFWSGPLAGTALPTVATTQAVILPDGTSWWLLFGTAPDAPPTAMVKATLSVAGSAYSGSGKVYALDSSTVSSLALSGITATATSVSATVTQPGTSGTSTATLTAASAYRTPAVLSSLVGTWQTSLSGGVARVTLQIDAAGTLTGTDTKGCVWSGTVALHPAGNAVYNYNTTENCGVGLVTNWNGIGVLNAAKTASTLFVTNPGDSRGFVLSFAKQ